MNGYFAAVESIDYLDGVSHQMDMSIARVFPVSVSIDTRRPQTDRSVHSSFTPI